MASTFGARIVVGAAGRCSVLRLVGGGRGGVGLAVGFVGAPAAGRGACDVGSCRTVALGVALAEGVAGSAGGCADAEVLDRPGGTSGDAGGGAAGVGSGGVFALSFGAGSDAAGSRGDEFGDGLAVDECGDADQRGEQHGEIPALLGEVGRREREQRDEHRDERGDRDAFDQGAEPHVEPSQHGVATPTGVQPDEQEDRCEQREDDERELQHDQGCAEHDHGDRDRERGEHGEQACDEPVEWFTAGEELRVRVALFLDGVVDVCHVLV
jgi:hypothetical protein